MRALKETTALGLVLGLTAGAYAQTRAIDNTPPVEPSNRDTRLDVTPTGTPIVNIARPNARGTSHNIYRRFNVGVEGLILNNSTEIGQSVLGGQLLANPNLRGGASATLIINEVLGGTRSDLRGAMEIFGPGAAMILANPAGITCDGCGFVNVPRVSLSTGRPMFGDDGGFLGFSVDGGDVSIEGQGLLAGNVDFFDIVTASAAINASLYARDLVIAGGSADFDFAGRTATARAGGNDRLAIDSSLLGGMYANRIRLIGTGAGVGVNLAGAAVALEGPLEISAGGAVTVRSAASASDVVVRSTGGAIRIDERLYAGGDLTLAARGDVTQAGDILGAAGNVTIESGGDVRLGGSGVYAGLSAAGRLDGRGGIDIAAVDAVTAPAQVLATGDVALSGGRVLLGHASEVRGANIALSADERLAAGGTIGAEGDLSLRGGTIDLIGDTVAAGRLVLDGDRITLGTLATGLVGVEARSTGQLDIAAHAGLQTNGELVLAARELANRGRLSGGAGASLTLAGGLSNSGDLLSGGDLRLRIGGDAMLGGTVAAAGDLSLTARDLAVAGSVSAGGDLALGGARIGIVAGSTVAANGDVDAIASEALRVVGDVSSAGDLSIESGGALTLDGRAAAAGDMNVTAADLTLSGAAVADGLVSVVVDGTAAIVGEASGREGLSLRGTDIAMGAAGRLVSGGAVDVSASRDLANAGVVSGERLALRAGGRLTNDGELIGASSLVAAADRVANAGLAGSNGDVRIEARSIELAGSSLLQAGGTLRIAATENLATAGSVVAVGAADFSGGIELTQGADVRLGASGDFATRGALTNAGAIAAIGDLSFDAGRLTGAGAIASNGSIAATAGDGGIDYEGSLTAVGDLSLSTPTTLRLSGLVQSGGVLGLAADSVSLEGRSVGIGGVETRIAGGLSVGTGGALLSGAGLALDLADIRNAGVISARDGLDLRTRGDVDNRGILYAGGPLSLGVGGALSNGGHIRSDAQARLSVGTDALLGGTLVAGAGLDVSAGAIAVTGAIVSGDALALTAGGDLAIASDATVMGGGATALSAGGELQSAGVVSSEGALSLAAVGDLDFGGLVQSVGALNLSGDRVGLSGTLVSLSGLDIAARLDLSVGGDVFSRGALTARAGSLSVLSGAGLASGAGVDLGVAGDASLAGTLAAAGDLSLRTGGALDVGGRVQAGGGADLSAGGHAVVRGVVASAGALGLSGTAVAVDGAVLSDAGARVSAVTGDLRVAGAIATAGDLTLDAVGALDLAGTARADGSLSLRGGDILLSGTAAGLGGVSAQASGSFLSGAASLLASGGQLDLVAGGIAAQGSIQAAGDIRFSAGAIDLSGSVAGGGSLLLDAGSVAIPGSLNAAGGIRVASGGDLAVSGALRAGGGLDLTAGGDLSNAGAIASGGSAQLVAGGALVSGGQLLSEGDLLLSGGQLSLAGVSAAAGDVQAEAGGGLTVSGDLSAAGGALLAATDILIEPAGRVIADGDLSLSATASLEIRGLAAAGGDVDLAYGTSFAGSGTISSGGDLGIATALDFTHDGRLFAGGTLRIDARDVLIRGALVGEGGVAVGGRDVAVAAGGVVQSGRDLSLTAGAGLRVGGGLLALGDMALTGADIAVTGSAQAGGVLALTTPGTLTSDGLLASATSVRIEAADATIGGRLLSDGAVSLSITNALSTSGLLSAGGALTIQGRDVTLDGAIIGGSVAVSGQDVALLGSLDALGTINLSATGGLLLTDRARIAGLGDAALSAARLNILGAVALDGRLDARATSALAVNGQVSTAGGASFVAGSELGVAGAVASLGAIVLQGPDIRVSGSVESARIVDVEARRFAASGLLAAGETMAIRATDVQLDANGRMLSGAALSVDAGNDVRLDGELSAAGDLAITGGGDLVLAGIAASGARATLSGATIDLSGELLAEGDATLRSVLGTRLSGALVAGGWLRVDADRVDVTASGDLLSGLGLELRARTDLDVAGRAASAGSALLSAGRDLVNRGAILAGGDAGLTAAGTMNAGGTVEAGGRLSLDAPTLAIGGTLTSGAGLALSGHDITLLSSTRLAAGGDLDVRANRDLLTAGLIATAGTATLGAGGRLGHDADLSAGRDASLAAGAALDLAGAVRAGGTLNLSGASVSATGNVLSNGPLTVVARGDMLLGGELASSAEILLRAAGDLSISGLVTANGRLAATARDVAIGDLVIGKAGLDVTATGAVALDANGVLATDGALALAARDLDNTGTLSAGSDLGINLVGDLRNADLIAAGGGLTITAGALVNEADAAMFGGAETRIVAGDIGIDGRLFSAGSLTFSGSSLTIGGDVRSIGAMQAIMGGDLALADGSLLVSDSAVLLDAQGALDASGQVFSGAGLDVRAVGLLATSGELQARGDLRLSGGALALGGMLANDGDLAAVAADGLTLAGRITALGDVDLVAGGGAALVSASSVLTGGALSIRADRIETEAALGAAGSIVLASATDLRSRGSIASGADVEIAAGALLEQRGTLDAAGRIDVTGGRLTLGGAAVGAAGLAIDGDTVTLAAGADWQSGAALQLVSRGDVANAGGLLAAGPLTAVVGGDFRQDGLLYAARGLTLDVGGAFINGGDVQAAGREGGLRLTAGSLTNSGSIVSDGTLGLTIAGDAGIAGEISAASGAMLRVAGTADIAGTLVSGGGLDFAAGALATSAQGALLSGAGMTLNVGGAWTHLGLASSGGTLTATAANISATGDLESEGALTLSAGAIAVSGRTWSNGAISLASTSGPLLAGGSLRGAGATLTSAGDLGLLADGALASSGAVIIHAAGNASVEGRVASNGDLDVSAGRDVDFGAAALLQTGADFGVVAGGALRNDGRLEAAGDISLAGAAVTSRDALADDAITIGSAGDLTLTGSTDAAGTVTLGSTAGAIAVTAEASVRSGSTITLTAAGNVGNAGAVAAETDLSLTSGTGIASTGLLVARTGRLALTAPRLELGGAAYGDLGLALLAPDVVVTGSVGTDASFAFQGASISIGAAGSLQSNAAVAIDASALDVQGRLLALGTLRATADTIAVGEQGALGAGGALALSAGRELASRGTIQTGGDLTLAAPRLDLRGAVSAMRRADLSGVAVTVSGVVEAGRALAVAADAFITGTAGALRSAAELTVDAGSVDHGGAIEAQGPVAVRAGGVLASDGRIASNASVLLTGGEAARVGGTVVSAGTISVAAGGIAQTGTLAGNGDVTLQAGSGALSIVGEVVSADGRVTLSGGQALILGATAEVFAARGLDATGARIDNAGALLSLGSVQLRAADAIASSGRIAAQDAVTLSALAGAPPLRRIDLAGGQVEAGSIGLEADVLALGGTMRAAGSVALNGGDATVSGSLQAGGAITLAPARGMPARSDLSVLAGAELVSGDDILLGALGRLTVGGLVSAGSDLVAAYGDQASITGRLEAGQDVHLRYAGVAGALNELTLQNAGEIAAGRDIALTGGTIASSGLIYAGNDVRISTENLLAGGGRSVQLGGTVIAGRDLSVSTIGDLGVDGQVRIGRDGAFTARSHDVSGDIAAAGRLGFTNRTDGGTPAVGFSLTGRVRSGGVLSVETGAGQAIVIGAAGLAVSNSELRLSGATINSAGTLAAGDLVSLASPGGITLGGLVQSGRRIEVDAGAALSILGGARLETVGNAQSIGLTRGAGASANIALSAGTTLSNAGTLYSDGSVALRSGSGSIANSGLITGLRGVALETDGAVGNYGRITGGGLAIFQRQAFNNAGAYTVEGNLLISAPSIGNAGLIGAGGSLTLQADGSVHNGGTLFAGADLGLTAGGAFHNDGGLTLAGGGIGIAAASVVNESGTIEAMGGDVAITTGSLVNRIKALVISTDATGTDTLVASSGAAQIVGAGNVVINAGGGEITNSNSHILAGGNVHLAAGTVNNIANYLRTTRIEPITEQVEVSKTAPGIVDCPPGAIAGSCVQTPAGVPTPARTDWQEYVTVQVGTRTEYRDITEIQRTTVTLAGATACPTQAIAGTCVIRPAVSGSEPHGSWDEMQDVTVTKLVTEWVPTGRITDHMEDAYVDCNVFPNLVPGSCSYRPGTMVTYTYWKEYEYEERQVEREVVEQRRVTVDRPGATQCPPTAISGTCVLTPAGESREASAIWDELQPVVIGREPVTVPVTEQQARDFSSEGEIACPPNAISGSCRVTPAGTAAEASTSWREYVTNTIGERTVTTEAPLPTTIRAGGTVSIAAAQVNNGTITSQGGFQSGFHTRPDTNAAGATAQGGRATFSGASSPGAALDGNVAAPAEIDPRDTFNSTAYPVVGVTSERYFRDASRGRGAGTMATVGSAGVAGGGSPVGSGPAQFSQADGPAAADGVARADASVIYRVVGTGSGAPAAGTVGHVSVTGPGGASVSVGGPAPTSVNAAGAGRHAGAAVGTAIGSGQGHSALGVEVGGFGRISLGGPIGRVVGETMAGVTGRDGLVEVDGPQAIGRAGVGSVGRVGAGASPALGVSTAGSARLPGGSTGLVLPMLDGAAGRTGEVILDVLQRFRLVGGTGGLNFADGSSLFTFNDAEGADSLINTRPGLSGAGALFDSDYFFDAIGRDRETHFARLGDGFFEAQLISQQVRAATNGAYLPRFGGALEQAQGLMQAAADQQARLGLALGVALTADQVAQLTTSIVWWVKASVDGREVLVPVVYLAAADEMAVQDGALIAGQVVAVRVGGDLRNSGTIAADRLVSLSAGGDILNGAGGRIAGGAVVADAARDILNGGGSRITGTDIVLSAGRDVRLDNIASTISSADFERLGRRNFTSTRTSETTVTGSELVATGNLVVDAGRDIDVIASSLSAGGSAALVAGRDVNIGGVSQTETTTEAWRTGRRRHGTETQTETSFVGSAIAAGGDLLVGAGNRVAVTGSNLSAAGGIAVEGATVEIGAAQNLTTTELAERRGRTRTNATASATTNILSNLVAGGDLTVSSPGTVSVEGANLAAGGTAAIAAETIEIAGVVDTAVADVLTRRRRSGFLSSTRTTTRTTSSDETVVASSVTGGQVDIASTGGTSILGSTIAATGDARIAAGGALDIGAIEEEDSTSQSTRVRRSGLSLSSSGLFAGVSSSRTNTTSTSVTNVGSLIGSAEGRVALDSGRALTLTGSTVVAPGAVSLTGESVAIAAATDRTTTTGTSRSSSVGVSVGVQSPVIAGVQSALNMADAVANSGSSRTQLVGTAAGALAVANTADAVGSALSRGGNPIQSGLASVSVTFGVSSSSSRSNTTAETAARSEVSGGDVSITARGAGAGSTINVTGSDVRADGDLTLAAEGAIALRSAVETSTSASSNRSSGFSAGIQIGAGGITPTASLNLGQGRANGTEVGHAESSLSAGGTTRVTTPGALTIQGATLGGQRVEANVGSLRIESEQDTAEYRSRQTNVSLSGSMQGGGAGGSVSGNVSSSTQRGSFASVAEQSGIFAGSGGYDVRVAGGTALVGGVIASEAGAAANSLSTGTLSVADIQNRERYSASSVSLGGGISGIGASQSGSQGGSGANGVGTNNQGEATAGADRNPGSGLPGLGGVSATAPVAMGASGSQSGATRSAIAAGSITVTSGDAASQAAAASVSRDTGAANDGALVREFTEERREEIERGFAVTRELATQTATFFENRGQEERELREAAERARAAGDDAEADRLTDRADALERTYGAGSTVRLIATAVNGAAGSNVAGGLGDLVRGAAVNVLQGLAVEQVAQLADSLGRRDEQGRLLVNADGSIVQTPESEMLRGALQAVVGCAGAAAGGSGGCGSAAAGAAASVAVNLLVNALDEERRAGRDEELRYDAEGRPVNPVSLEDQAARTNLVATIVAGIGAVAGLDVAAASTAAQIETQNNDLGGYQPCPPGGTRCVGRSEFLAQPDVRRMIEILGISEAQAWSCATTSNVQCAQGLDTYRQNRLSELQRTGAIGADEAARLRALPITQFDGEVDRLSEVQAGPSLSFTQRFENFFHPQSWSLTGRLSDGLAANCTILCGNLSGVDLTDPMARSEALRRDRDAILTTGLGYMTLGPQDYAVGQGYRGTAGTAGGLLDLLTTNPLTTIENAWNTVTTPSSWFSEARACTDFLCLGINTPGLADAAVGAGVGQGAVRAGSLLSTADRLLDRSGARVSGVSAPAPHRWDPTQGVGPLGDPSDVRSVAATFRSGTYTETTLSQPTVLYRVISDNGNETGSYWTRVPPAGPLQSVIDSALDQSWGNSATRVVTAVVPAGTRIFEGAAANQRGLVGGGNQVYIQNVSREWIRR